MPLTQGQVEDQLRRLSKRVANLERRGPAFTENPLSASTDLRDLGDVKTFLGFEEPALAPTAPPADVLRLYAKDIQASTELYVNRADNLPQRVSGAFAYDTFDRADSSTLGSLDSGQAWTETTGDVKIRFRLLEVDGAGVTNLATFPLGYQENLEAGIFIRYNAAPSAANSDWGFVFRYVDANNFVMVWVNHTNLSIYTNVAGVFTQLDNRAFSTAPGNGSIMHIQVWASGGVVFARGTALGGSGFAEVGLFGVAQISNVWSAALRGGLGAGFRWGLVGDVVQVEDFRVRVY